MLNSLNPLGFVSKEFSLMKEFILINLALEYLDILVSCAIATLMFGLAPSIAALFNRITLDGEGYRIKRNLQQRFWGWEHCWPMQRLYFREF